jgi:hypothetical protein
VPITDGIGDDTATTARISQHGLGETPTKLRPIPAPSLFFGADNSDISQPSDAWRFERLPRYVPLCALNIVGIAPLIGLTQGEGRAPISMRLQQLGIHVLFGIVLAAFLELGKDRT